MRMPGGSDYQKNISSWSSREAPFDIEAWTFADQSSICLRVSSFLLRICDVGGVTFSDIVISGHPPTAAAGDWNAACVSHRWRWSDLSLQTWAARCLYAI